MDYKNMTALESNFLDLFDTFCRSVQTSAKYVLLEKLFDNYQVDDPAYHMDDMYWHGIFDYFQKKVMPHKVFVYEAGFELWRDDYIREKYIKNVPFIHNLLIHDLSKFSANEAFGYAMHNFKSKEKDQFFELAWHHHKMNNPHHPEYWLNPDRSGGLDIMPMPSHYVVEMIADWMGAGKTYGSTLEQWLPDNLYKFLWHEQTAIVACDILKHLGHGVEKEGTTLSIPF